MTHAAVALKRCTGSGPDRATSFQSRRTGGVAKTAVVRQVVVFATASDEQIIYPGADFDISSGLPSYSGWHNAKASAAVKILTDHIAFIKRDSLLRRHQSPQGGGLTPPRPKSVPAAPRGARSAAVAVRVFRFSPNPMPGCFLAASDRLIGNPARSRYCECEHRYYPL